MTRLRFILRGLFLLGMVVCGLLPYWGAIWFARNESLYYRFLGDPRFTLLFDVVDLLRFVGPIPSALVGLASGVVVVIWYNKSLEPTRRSRDCSGPESSAPRGSALIQMRTSSDVRRHYAS